MPFLAARYGFLRQKLLRLALHKGRFFLVGKVDAEFVYLSHLGVRRGEGGHKGQQYQGSRYSHLDDF